MIEKDDWRLLNDVAYLKGKYYDYSFWFVPEDISCCICENCYSDFKEMFEWKDLDGWDIDWSAGTIAKEAGERG